jgi:hypothetical protein
LRDVRSCRRVYGVADGDGDGDSSAPAAFFLEAAFFGEADGEASVVAVVFFFVAVVLAAVVDFFAAVPFFVVEAEVVVEVVAVSFLFAQETKNATATRTMMELRTVFFIRCG